MNKEKNKNKSIDTTLAILPISSVAQALNVHQRTLRIYDEQKLLVARRSKQNRRLYSLNDIQKGKLIQFLTRNLAINLAGVRIVLRLVEMEKIKPELYIKYIKDVAKSAKIDSKIQQYNAERLSKRGKKPGKTVAKV